MMKNIIISLTILFCTSTLVGQEKIADITTTHMNLTGPSVNLQGQKMAIKFELYKDSLVMTYTNKGIIRSLEKQGIPSKLVMEYPFTKKVESHGDIYSFQNEEKKISVTIPNGVPKPNVRIQTKDEFSGDVTEQLFISI